MRSAGKTGGIFIKYALFYMLIIAFLIALGNSLNAIAAYSRKTRRLVSDGGLAAADGAAKKQRDRSDDTGQAEKLLLQTHTLTLDCTKNE